MKRFHTTAGFTLVELMLVIAVLAVIVSIGAPSFSTLIKNYRLSSATNDVVGALHFARAEAVRRGRNVEVTSITNTLTDGIRVWYDADSDNAFDDGEELRVVRLTDVANLQLSNQVDGADSGLGLIFSPRGTVSGAGSKLELTLCDDRSGAHGKQVSLLASGVLRSSKSIGCN